MLLLKNLFQVDNPVSVLTQEMSKQFLQSKNEGDKYKVRDWKYKLTGHAFTYI
jgi:hypothetical protein